MLLHRVPDELRIVQRVYDAKLRLRSHAHALPSMSIVLRGAVEESRGRRVETALPFSVSFMGADIAHDDAFSPRGAAMCQVHFESLDTIGEEQRTLLERWTWLRGGAVVRPFLRLVAAARSQRADEIEQMVADVIAAASEDAAPRGAAAAVAGARTRRHRRDEWMAACCYVGQPGRRSSSATRSAIPPVLWLQRERVRAAASRAVRRVGDRCRRQHRDGRA
jgi:hypothetical protein